MSLGDSQWLNVCTVFNKLLRQFHVLHSLKKEIYQDSSFIIAYHYLSMYLSITIMQLSTVNRHHSLSQRISSFSNNHPCARIIINFQPPSLIIFTIIGEVRCSTGDIYPRNFFFHYSCSS